MLGDKRCVIRQRDNKCKGHKRVTGHKSNGYNDLLDLERGSSCSEASFCFISFWSLVDFRAMSENRQQQKVTQRTFRL